MSVTLKIELPDTQIRRVAVPAPVTLAGLTNYIATQLVTGPTDRQLVLSFKDSEGDVVTIGSDAELADVLNMAAKMQRVPKFAVTFTVKPAASIPVAVPVAVPVPEPVPEPKPKNPVMVAAQALADPAVVGSILNVVNSPIVSEAVTSVAQAVLDNPDHPEKALETAMEQLPLLQTLWSDLVREQPIVEETVKGFADAGMLCPPLFAAAFGFAAPPAALCVHRGVVCDGCDQHADLKAVAALAGTFDAATGFIAGPRYKSMTADDFDLCDKCHATDRFNAQAPFVKMDKPLPWGGGGCHRRGPCGPGRPQHHGPHHHGPHHAGFGGGGGPWGGRGPCGPRRGDKMAEALRGVLAQGAMAFAEASEGEMAEIARAISASLMTKDEAAAAAKPKDDVKPAVPQPPPPASPVVQAPAVPSPVESVPEGWEEVQEHKWAAQIAQLQAIGFAMSEDDMVALLEEEKGDLEKVVNRIVRRNA